MNYETNVRGCFPLFPSELRDFMHRIEITQGNNWRAVRENDPGNSLMAPESIDTRCGYCGRHGALMRGKDFTVTHETKTATFQARCTFKDCGQMSTAIVINAVSGFEWGAGQRPKEIWVLPKPEFREPRISVSEIDNKRIAKAYRDALDSFNNDKASLSISACGRIVEAVGKIKFPNSKEISNIAPLFNNLRKELKQAPAFKEVLMPLIELGEALRLGRNPGSHFDLEVDPDLDLAGKVLDLTEFLLQYVFIIAGEAEKVNLLIEECIPGDAEETE